MTPAETLRAYRALTKPRIVTLSLLTMTMGFFLGNGHLADFGLLALTLLGTGLVASGACALNQYLERDADAQMERTRDRPIPAGHVQPQHALVFGLYLVMAGLVVLLWGVNLLTAFLVLLSAFLYVLVYTPLKRYSPVNTSVGAIPGAIPPLAGWTAARGDVGLGGLAVFLILFVWQHPHFFAIAWMYRDDYRRAGFRMLSTDDPDGARTARGVVITTALLVLVSLLPVVIGMSHAFYLVAALALGTGFMIACMRLVAARTTDAARAVLRASIYYLPLILGCIVIDTLIQT